MRAARLPGGAGAGSERCTPQSGEGAGALRGHTRARLLPPGRGGWGASAILNFFRTIRISVGNFCRRQRHGGGGRGRRVAWWGAPQSPLGPCVPQCPAHLGDTTHLGPCGGPAGAALLAVGGLPPTPPPRAVASAMRWVWFARSTSQPRTAAVAAPRRPPPGRQRGAPPGRAAPLRSAPRCGTARPCLLDPPPPPRCSAARPGRWNPSLSPVPTPGPAERGVEVSVPARSVGKGEYRSRGCDQRAGWAGPSVRILGAAPRPCAATEGPGRAGGIGFCLFRLSHFSFKGKTSARIARSFKTRTPMVIAIAKHPRLALRCLDLISPGALLEEESAGSRRLLLSPRLSACAPVWGRHGKYFLHWTCTLLRSWRETT